jgi:hypothetical protein
LFFINSLNLFSQISISFYPTFDNYNLELNTFYPINETETDSIQFTSLKFYISDITFWENKKQVYTLEQKHFLLDLSNPNSLIISENKVEKFDFTTITFNLGIDSLTNVSGALEGDLDPSNGMYWTWQSGYINFKLEGISSNCPTRKNKFQFHLGGYQSPFYGLRKINLNSTQPNSQIEIHLDQFLNSVDLVSLNQVMSPSVEAMALATYLASAFRMKK